MKKPTMIVITGPTASGKSALAVSVAKKLDTEIISADSRQIYKGIPIVTAVPSKEEQEGVRHHLLEILPLEAYYSAACFQEDVSTILQDLFKSRENIVVCGGSMLYIDALIEGIDNLPTVPAAIRNKLMSDWEEYGDEWLLARLKTIDADYYQKVDLNNLKRVFHAIEVSLTAGKPYSSLLTGGRQKIELPYDVIKVCLDGNRDILFERINQRVLKMINSGLEEEARDVYPLRHLNSLNTVGLKEMFTYFEGGFTFEEAVGRIQKNTRVYAKKQITWHKRKENTYLDFTDSISVNTEKILKLLSQKS